MESPPPSEFRLPRPALRVLLGPTATPRRNVSISPSPSSLSSNGIELHFFLFWETPCWRPAGQSRSSGASASSRFNRGGFGGGEQARKRFCSLWELCRRRPWPICRNDRSPKLSVWASLPMCEMWRKSASGRLIMLTDSTSLRLELLQSQRAEPVFLYKDVLSGILTGLIRTSLSVLVRLLLQITKCNPIYNKTRKEKSTLFFKEYNRAFFWSALRPKSYFDNEGFAAVL